MDPHLRSHRYRSLQRCLEEPRKQIAFGGCVDANLGQDHDRLFHATKIHQSRCRFTLPRPKFLRKSEVSVPIDELITSDHTCLIHNFTAPRPEKCLVSWLVVVLGTKCLEFLYLSLSAASCNMRGLQRKRKSAQKRRIPPQVHCISNHPQLGKLSSGWKMAKPFGQHAVFTRIQLLGGFDAPRFCSWQSNAAPLDRYIFTHYTQSFIHPNSVPDWSKQIWSTTNNRFTHGAKTLWAKVEKSFQSPRHCVSQGKEDG